MGRCRWRREACHVGQLRGLQAVWELLVLLGLRASDFSNCSSRLDRSVASIPISLMKACTMSLLLLLGCTVLRSGWCLHGRAAGALVGRLLSLGGPAFDGGATAWEVDFLLGSSCPSAALGSGSFPTAPFPGAAASSVAWVPGDAPAARDTSAGQQLGAGAAFRTSEVGAAWGSSIGWMGTAGGSAACWAGSAGGTLLGCAAAADGAARGCAEAGAALRSELSPASRACLLGSDTLLATGLAGPPAVPTSPAGVGGGWAGNTGGSGPPSTGVAGGCLCRVPPAGKAAAPCRAATGSPYARGGTSGGGTGIPGQ